jgi:Fe-S oxidoreductase
MEHMPAIAKAKKEGQEELPEALVTPQYISVDTMWACTSCNACVEACPVGNDPMTKLLDLRRSKVLMEGELPNELALTLTNMENQSNPWGINAEKRADWAQDLGIPTLADNAEVDYLFWVGCAGSFDDRAKKVSVALTKVLKHAGISFGILGTEEQCSGDSARRGGNEYLYQMLAQGNVDTMNGYGVKKIITTCPHCFNTIKNEYPQFGGNYEVYHHTQFLADLMSSGKLPSSKDGKEKIAYHDSCYMGRYNKEYDAPRSVIKNVGKVVADPPRSHSKSFCCGAGGARMWMEEDEPRVNDNRTQELLEQNTNTIATNCPFCMTMIEDGVKNKEKEDDVKVKDIAELVAQELKL